MTHEEALQKLKAQLIEAEAHEATVLQEYILAKKEREAIERRIQMRETLLAQSGGAS